jgi:hypothetical protein
MLRSFDLTVSSVLTFTLGQVPTKTFLYLYSFVFCRLVLGFLYLAVIKFCLQYIK